jgi:hypothetical protein
VVNEYAVANPRVCFRMADRQTQKYQFVVPAHDDPRDRLGAIYGYTLLERLKHFRVPQGEGFTLGTVLSGSERESLKRGLALFLVRGRPVDPPK